MLGLGLCFVLFKKRQSLLFPPIKMEDFWMMRRETIYKLVSIWSNLQFLEIHDKCEEAETDSDIA